MSKRVKPDDAQVARFITCWIEAGGAELSVAGLISFAEAACLPIAPNGGDRLQALGRYLANIAIRQVDTDRGRYVVMPGRYAYGIQYWEVRPVTARSTTQKPRGRRSAIERKQG